MIPSTKKEWQEWWIVETAKQLAWDALDDIEQKAYIKTVSKYIPDRVCSIIDLDIPFVRVSAIRVVWDELSKKEQNYYRSEAQKKLSKESK